MFTSFFTKLATIIATPILAVGSFLGLYQEPQYDPAPSFGAALPQVAALFETSLAAPITSSASTMTLVTNSVRGGGTLSGRNCFTIDEGSSQAEFVCGVVSGTSVTSLSRGISPSNGTSTIAALQFAHRRGASVKITDFPVIQILKAQLNGEDTFENPIKYATSVSTTTLSQSDQNIPNVAYVNGIAFSGASVIDATAAARGISELATAAEAAASTAQGSSGILVLPASLSTSTYNAATAANRVVVTNSNGEIDDDFIPNTIATTTTFSAPMYMSGGATSTFALASTSSFTSTFTWTRPSGIKQLIVELVGGGGKGSTATGDGGAGGGGGAYCKAVINAVSLPSSATVTVGATSTATSFGSLVIAGGGTAASGATPGAGGDCSGSITNMIKIENFDGTAPVGDAVPTPDFVRSGRGGGSVYGQGGDGARTETSGQMAGETGTGYGSGGGGAVVPVSGNIGGDGKPGLAILTEIFN